MGPYRLERQRHFAGLPRSRVLDTYGAHAPRGRNMGAHGDHGAKGTIRVPRASQASRWETVWPMADEVAGGKSQLTSPRQDVVKASTHSASGWK